jgi:hypothetical protein
LNLVAVFEDPIKKHEKFSVDLRKKKNQEIIRNKRRKIMDSENGGEGYQQDFARPTYSFY